jgi:hypothetical protein
VDIGKASKITVISKKNLSISCFTLWSVNLQHLQHFLLLQLHCKVLSYVGRFADGNLLLTSDVHFYLKLEISMMVFFGKKSSYKHLIQKYEVCGSCDFHNEQLSL